MKKGFEEYLRENRDHFEQGCPSSDLRTKLESSLREQHRKTKAPIIRHLILSAAAACILFIVGLMWWGRQQDTLPGTTAKNIPVEPIIKDTSKQSKKEQLDAQEQNAKPDAVKIDPQTAGIQQSLFQYAKSVQLREEKLLPLQASDPDLYKRSQKALQDLKQVYTQLKAQLKISPDTRQVEALLLQNLKLQQQLLDNQIQLLLPDTRTEIHEHGTKNI